MQAFTFRLQTFLDQKLDLEAKAKIAVAEEQRLLREQQAALFSLEEKERQVARAIRQTRDELLRASAINAGADVQRRNESLAALKQDLGAAHSQTLVQRFAVEEAEVSLDQAQAYALECFREAEKLSKYRENVKTRSLAEAAKKEELEQDELGTARYLSRRAGR